MGIRISSLLQERGAGGERRVVAAETAVAVGTVAVGTVAVAVGTTTGAAAVGTMTGAATVRVTGLAALVPGEVWVAATTARQRAAAVDQRPARSAGTRRGHRRRARKRARSGGRSSSGTHRKTETGKARGRARGGPRRSGRLRRLPGGGIRGGGEVPMRGELQRSMAVLRRLYEP